MIELIAAQQWSIPQKEKEALLLPELISLTAHHHERCAPYAAMLDAAWPHWRNASDLESLPFIPVRIFKTHELSSIATTQRTITMTSSGTTGAAVSRIFVDPETAGLQTQALTSTMTAILGKARLPMLVLDSKSVISDPRLLSARGGGVLGMMRYGRNHVFALRPDSSLDNQAVRRFLSEHANKPFFMFGFTFMVWLHLYQAMQDAEIDLSHGLLVHSGGWKKLQDLAVDNLTFRQKLGQRFGLTQIFNFYGMVEQMGSIFLESEVGHGLRAPNVTDVIIRDPMTLKPLPIGREGLVQLLSILPRSYPGHSILTEDMGAIVAVDQGPHRMGKTIRISGRLPMTELRGCSDVIAETLGRRA